MIRILEAMHSLSGGGVESMMLGYLSHMDRTDLQFDFLVYGDQTGALEAQYEQMGCRILRVPFRGKDPIGHMRKTKQIVRDGGYDVVHSHQSQYGFLTLKYAKKYGVKTRVLHAHNAFPPESLPRKLFRIVGAALGKRYATDLFACSRDAGLWLYGQSAVEGGRVRVIPNAIELDRFAYDEALRAKMRTELLVNDHFVIGCVARFTEQKNHAFLLAIFSKILEKRPDALLLLAGDGELMDQTKALAQQMDITHAVRFLGVRTDVPALIQAMDAFVLPSRYEGLGIVFLEAQAAGLPTFGPNIPGARDTVITDLMTALKPDQGAQAWADAVLGADGLKKPRSSPIEALQAAGYDILTQAKALERFYRDAKAENEVKPHE